MANTKELTREERKNAKRKARMELKKIVGGLSHQQLKDFQNKPKGGVKGFLLGTNEEKE